VTKERTGEKNTTPRKQKFPSFVQFVVFFAGGREKRGGEAKQGENEQ